MAGGPGPGSGSGPRATTGGAGASAAPLTSQGSVVACGGIASGRTGAGWGVKLDTEAINRVTRGRQREK